MNSIVRYIITLCITLCIVVALGFSQTINSMVDPPAGRILKGTSLPVPGFTYSPELLQSVAGGINVFNETFEGTTTSWKKTGSWAIGTPTLVGPSTANGGTKVAATNLSGPYGSYASDSLISPVIVLPALAGATENIKIDFYEWYKTESSYDYAKTYVSTDGGVSWIQLDIKSGTQSSWRQKIIDISTYAGKSVKFLFLLTSDGSSSYDGWYIDDITVTKTVPSPFTATMLSVNSQQFPTIFMNIAVNLNGVGYAGLTQSNFQIFENGVRQTGCLDVTPPSASGGVRRADIIFLMDNSGSMASSQAAVSANVLKFVDSLTTRGVDFALGVCRYGDSPNSGAPIIEDGGILTTNATYFKNTLWTRNTINGGTEPGYKAITQSASGFSFRSGAQKIFIIITDETPDQGGSTLTDAITTCTNGSITLYALTLQSLYGDFEPITNASNGGVFDINADFSPILNSIAGRVANTYVVRYCASNTTLDGKQRSVNVAVSYSTYVDTARGSYTPGQAPVIVRTAATLALHSQAQLNNVPTSIAAQITDNAPPAVQSATLYYRTTGATTFSSVAMTAGSNNIWTGVIPASAVVNPGVDYYITATDGQSSSSSPSENPATTPYQISILPNVAPQVTHTKPTSLTVGTALSLTASVVDITNSVASVKLYYRITGQLVYQMVAMTLTSGTTYQGSIPASYVTAAGVDYYISGTDNFAVTTYNGTADVPHQVGAGTTPPPPSGFQITRIWDVPNDNGRFVWISWSVPAPPLQNQINTFFVDYWDKESRAWASVTHGGVPATLETSYQTMVRSIYDSTKTKGMYYSVYRVVAIGASVTYSRADSGYSLDNLAPMTPTGFAANRVGSVTALRWNPVPDADLQYYELHRSSNPNFVPDLSSYLAVTTTETYSDFTATGSATYTYKLIAVDHSGNKSAPATLTGTTSVEEHVGAIPEQFELAQNYPNPFNPSTVIRYSVPEQSRVLLTVSNTLGQIVEILEDNIKAAGTYSITWRAKLGSGTYFCRIEAVSLDNPGNRFVESRKMILVK